MIQKNKYKNKFKLFFAAAALILVLTLCFNTAVSASDWREHWARDIFEESIRLGILYPDVYGNIYPESPVMRGDLCAYINRVMGFTATEDISRYTDTPYGSEYHYAMSVAVAMGYISPTSNNTLSPYGNITRAQVIDIFAQVARLSLSPEDIGVLDQVRDSENIADENRDNVASAIVNGFIAGRSGYKIYPNDYMTVCEAIVLLDRLNSGKRVYAFPGTFGPAEGTVISNYSTILAPGVNLKNADTGRDLEIHQDAGNGEIKISGSSVGNKFSINGGGVIYLSKDNLNRIEVNKKDARLVFDENGNTEANVLVINGDNITVDINKGNKTNSIIINGSNATVNIGENVRIEDLTINGANAVINLAAGSRLETATLNAKAAVAGEGSVGSLNVNTGGGGSVLEPKPDETNSAPGENISVGEKPDVGGDTGTPGNPGTPAFKRITGMSFVTDLTLQVATEDVGKIAITANDFKVSVDGTPVASFTVSKSNNTEFNIILPSKVAPSAVVTVTGTGSLGGTVSASLNSQASITDAIVTGLRTISVNVANPTGKAFSKENFKLQIAGKDNDSFTVTAVSLTNYTLTISSDIKSGQVLTITGKNSLTGSATVSSLSAIKSIVFIDTDKFTVNTDNTAGNSITKDCFDLYIKGNITQNFTVSQKSTTAYQITLSTPISDGTAVRISGKKFLTGTVEDVYAFPFKVSKVAVTSRTVISVTLATVPDNILSADKHAASFQVLVDDISIPVKNIVKDTSDKKGTMYNLTVELAGTQGTLTVNGVKNTNNKGIVDYVQPELISVRLNDRALSATAPTFRTEQAKSKLIIEFSEPVFSKAPSTKFSNKDVAISGAAFNIISGTGGGIDLNGVKVSISANSITIDLAGAKRMDPGIYNFTLNSSLIFDSIGNVCVVPENNLFRFEIKGTFPTVASSKQLATGDIEIKLSGNASDNFGGAMSLGGIILISDPSKPVSDSIEVSHRFISYDTKAKAITISRAALPPALNDPNNPVFLSGDVPYRLELYHKDYSRDVWLTTPAEENPLTISRVTIDTQRPKIETVTINGIVLFDRATGLATTIPKISKANAVVQIIFSEPVFEAAPAKKFSTVDTYGQAFNIATANPLDPGNNLSLSGVKVTTNNKTVSIPLKNAAAMNPGSYKLDIDPALIYDAVGNTADLSDFRDLPGFPRLVCYFDVVTVPPTVTSVSQATNGDISVRFTRYYAWTTNPYGVDLYNMGSIRILDLSRPEGEQQIGDDITGEFFAPWNELTYSLLLRRAGLPDNLAGGPYVLEIDVPDYEKLYTPSIKITTGINNDPSVMLGKNGNIPVNPNAEQTRISKDDALITIRFPVSVTGKNLNALTISDLDATGDLSSYAFTVYVEDAAGVLVRTLDKSKITLNHRGNLVTIDLKDAITTEMQYMKFTIAVNQLEIYSGGAQIGNKINVCRFKLTESSPAITSAEQLQGSGDIQIKLYGISPEENKKANEYASYIDGSGNDKWTSAIQIERNGIPVGYIPSLNNAGKDYIDFSLVGNVLTIKKAALDLLESDGTPVKLDGGAYTIVLTHGNFSDNRTPAIAIDTTPPVSSSGGFNAQVTSGTATLTFTFNEPVTIPKLTVKNSNLSDAQNLRLDEEGAIIIIMFSLGGLPPSDYTVNLTAADKFGNRTEMTCNPVIPEKHTSGFIEKVSGYINFYNSLRKVTSADLAAILAKVKPEYDEGLSAPAVPLKAEFSVTAPENAKSYKYAVSKKPVMQNVLEFTHAGTLDGENKTITLNRDVYFYASNPNGSSIQKSQSDNSTEALRKSWAWTIADEECYYIFEWTMADGTKTYTYVQAFE